MVKSISSNSFRRRSPMTIGTSRAHSKRSFLQKFFFKHQVAMREEAEPCSNYFQFQNRSFHSFTTSTTTTACGRVDFNLFFVKSQFAHSPLNKFLSASDDSARRWIDTPALEVACLVGQKNKNHSTFQNRSCMWFLCDSWRRLGNCVHANKCSEKPTQKSLWQVLFSRSYCGEQGANGELMQNLNSMRSKWQWIRSWIIWNQSPNIIWF